ncbi:MAG TPA: response regulator, partial [Chitinispirillaceae bacterium]|nr:response regulator [Chitinispirillaceae bacterium]
IDIDYNCPSRIKGDPTRLRQILLNILSNAIKFTDAGEIIISARSIPDQSQRTFIRFSVRDTGIGVPEEKQSTIFEKFVQADASTTRKFGGTGLGLTISKKLVEKMGGNIGVISPINGAARSINNGSEFWFTIPIESCSEHKSLPHNSTPCRKIIIIDDNASSRRSLNALLTRYGFCTECAADADSGLTMLNDALTSDTAFDLALIDLDMPGKNGEILGKMIKQHPDLQKIQLILMVSMKELVNTQNFKQIGFSDCIVKPVIIHNLLAMITKIFTGTTLTDVEPPPADMGIRERSDFSGVRILLAEDNEINQLVACGMLKIFGFEVKTVVNGAEAVNALTTEHFDAVLMDIQMPELDGYEATKQIRDPSSPVINHTIPIIAMTAHAGANDKDNCIKAGMNDYLTKPIDPDVLAQILLKWTKYRIETLIPGRYVPGKNISVFNEKNFLDRLTNNKVIARKVLFAFLDDLPGKISDIKKCAKSGDISTCQFIARTIKVVADNLGANTIMDTALAAENACAADDRSTLLNLINEIEHQFELFKITIEELKNDSNSFIRQN